MADSFATSIALNVLAAGRAPAWRLQESASSSGPPTGTGAGVALQQSIRGLLHIALREQVHRRTARLRISTLDLAATYKVAINGTEVSYNAGGSGAANESDVLNGIVAALSGNAPISAVAVASVVSTPAPHVLFRGVGPADYGIGGSSTGTGVVEIAADLTRATARLYWSMDARAQIVPPVPWVASPELHEIDRHGLIRRLETAGLKKLHVHLFDRGGHVLDGATVLYTSPPIWVGPGLNEVDGEI